VSALEDVRAAFENVYLGSLDIELGRNGGTSASSLLKASSVVAGTVTFCPERPVQSLPI
jgi:hypothetical protein